MINICGAREPLTKKRPKDWIDKGYTIRIPYSFKWRMKLGKVRCDCRTVIENYQPWYGFTWYHAESCATQKHFKKYPQMENFMWDRDLQVITQSD